MEKSVFERAKFRFEDLEIWQLAVEIAEILFDIADEFDEKKMNPLTLCSMHHAPCT